MYRYGYGRRIRWERVLTGFFTFIFRTVFGVLKWVLSLGARTLIVMAVVGLVGYGVLRYFDIIPEFGKTAEDPTTPTAAEAPYVVQTSSRIYYVAEFHEEGSTKVLDRYWELTGSGWVYGEELPLDEGAFGKVEIGWRDQK